MLAPRNRSPASCFWRSRYQKTLTLTKSPSGILIKMSAVRRISQLPYTRGRRSIRLQGYDYSQADVYFVTIVAQARACLFGEEVDGNVHLSKTGRMVSDCWQWLESQYAYVALDEYVLMPNHLHGLIMITDNVRRGGSRTAPTGEGSPTGKRKPLGRLIGAFKTVSTKQVKLAHDLPGKTLWQRNYFEHVVRSEESLDKIRQYIRDNPARWEFDRENPMAVRVGLKGL